jgi:hypothetical protein
MRRLPLKTFFRYAHPDQQWVRAPEARDVAALDRIMADDFVFTHPREGDDKGQFIADVESGDVRVEHMGRARVTRGEVFRDGEGEGSSGPRVKKHRAAAPTPRSRRGACPPP